MRCHSTRTRIWSPVFDNTVPEKCQPTPATVAGSVVLELMPHKPAFVQT
jgi:hypothetical protein